MASSPPVLSDLNEPQRQAVQHDSGAILVLAGAGSGKTRVITRRIAHLVGERRVAPEAILALTFTKKAATEMVNRIQSLMVAGAAGTAGTAGAPWTGTFHSWCARFLRRNAACVGIGPDFTILDRTDQIQAVKSVLEALRLSDSMFPPREVLSEIGRLKGRGFEVEDPLAPAGDLAGQTQVRIARAYRDLLRSSNALDFDDLLLFAIRALETNDDVRERTQAALEHVSVDEFQDTNRIQYALLRALAAPQNNICAVGDDDQSIYKWRGAEISNMRDFLKDFPGAAVVRLEENYRSTGHILAGASGLIRHNEGRFAKTLFTRAGEGRKITLYEARSAEEEAFYTAEKIAELKPEYPFGSFAVLYRTNAQSRLFEEAFRKKGIPHTVVGGVRFYERKEVKDCLAYVRVAWSEADDHALLRIVNVPPRGLGDASIREIKQGAAQSGKTLWKFIEEDVLAGSRMRAWHQKLAALADIVYDVRSLLQKGKPAEAIRHVIQKTDYARYLERDDPQTVRQRLQNVEELLSAAAAFEDSSGEGAGAAERVAEFFDSLALSRDIDAWEEDAGVSLITLHNAKGLEFPVVFIAGVEEKLLPHASCDDVEEERRLAYVGMTRARERLFLLRSERRKIAGRDTWPVRSRFLREIPAESLDQPVPAPPQTPRTPAAAVASFFGKPEAAGEIDQAASKARHRQPAKGSKVRHPKYGDGTVMEVRGQGDDMKVDIVFRTHGRKKFIWKQADLEVLS